MISCKETAAMKQKVEFICEWRTQKYSITDLDKVFNISRSTAYKLIDRFEKDVLAPFAEFMKNRFDFKWNLEVQINRREEFEKEKVLNK